MALRCVTEEASSSTPNATANDVQSGVERLEVMREEDCVDFLDKSTLQKRSEYKWKCFFKKYRYFYYSMYFDYCSWSEWKTFVVAEEEEEKLRSVVGVLESIEALVQKVKDVDDWIEKKEENAPKQPHRNPLEDFHPSIYFKKMF